MQAEKDIVGESLKDDIIETKDAKENTRKESVYNICGIYFMYEEGLFGHVSNFHNTCTIC